MNKVKLYKVATFGLTLFLGILVAMFIHQAVGRPASTWAVVVLGVLVAVVTFWLWEMGEGE